MTDALTTTTSAPPPDDKFLVALTPSDVPKAQAELREWCHAKIRALDEERSDLIDSADTAKRNNWQFATLMRLAKEKAAEIEYYRKILAAVEEGYLIVPNFQADVMAVKVPAWREDAPWSRAHWRPSALDQVAPDVSVPAGEGKYVNPQPKHKITYENEPEKDGTRHMVKYFIPDGLMTPKFPVIGVKPVILEATSHAMSKLIFDQIEVVTGKRKDPVVMGTIFHPKDRYRNRRVSFFIAWWLDTRSL